MKRCPPIDELERALADDQGAEAIREHVATCPKCRHRADRIRDNNDFLDKLRDGDSLAFESAARAADADARSSAPVIEGFELLRELHRGGQGVIYLARQRATKRIVAIKLLLAATLATSRQRRRFEREIEIVAGLRHPQIVTVFESGTTSGGWLWFAMEYVEGVPLDIFVNERRPPMNEVLRLMATVCDAVAYAHQRGIIHRDLKPANILVDANSVPHVLDFGLAKVTGSAVPDATVGATRTGEFMGTFAYAAPEQFRGSPNQIDTRSDVYALGTILYEALTGRHPFPASGSLAEFVQAVDQRDVVRPSLIAPGVSEELEAVILCALAREPVRRYQSAGALGQDLLRVLAGEPVEARRDSRWYLLRRVAYRHRFAMSAAAAFVVVAMGFAVLTAFQARRVARERDKAVVAEQSAARTAENLAIALSTSNIERGRLLARSGNIPLGERMLWREWGAARASRGAQSPWPPDDDVYWALWELYSRSPCRRTLRVIPGAKPRMAASRDAALLAVCDNAGTLKLFSLPDFTLRRDFGVQPAGVTAVTISPDRKLLASGDDRGELTLWDIVTGSVVRRFSPASGSVRNICFTADAEFVVVHGHVSQVTAWSREGRKVESELLRHAGILSIDASPMGQRIAIALRNGLVRVGDLTGSHSEIISPDSPGEMNHVLTLKFSPGGTHLAVGRWDGKTEVWDIAAKRFLWSRRVHNGATLTLDFSPDGRLLASGGRDRTVCISAADDGRSLRVLSGHTDVMTSVHFFEDAGQIVTASADSLVRVWETGEQPGTRILAQHGHTAFHVGFSADGRFVSSCGAGSVQAQVHEMITGKSVADLSGHGGIVAWTEFSPKGDTLATCGFDRGIRVWNAANGRCETVLKGHENYVECVAYCLDGGRLASASDDGTIRLWDLDKKECAMILRGHTDRCPMVAASPDGRTVASCSADKTVRLWSALDGRCLGVLSGHRMAVRTLAFTPDGKYLLSAGDETTIRVWDLAQRECIATMDGNEQDVFSIAISPDGRFVASTTRGGTIQLWSLARRRSLAVISEGHGGVFSVSFSPDGRTLASCGEDGLIRLHDMRYFDEHMTGNRAVQEKLAGLGGT